MSCTLLGLPAPLLKGIFEPMTGPQQAATRACCSALFSAFDEAADPHGGAEVAVSIAASNVVDPAVAWRAPVGPRALRRIATAAASGGSAETTDAYDALVVNLHWKHGPAALRTDSGEAPAPVRHARMVGNVPHTDHRRYVRIDEFCNGASELVTFSSADFNDGENRVVIGPQCFDKCTRLRSFDASGLRHVVWIGELFLSHCPALREIDLRGLNHLERIDARFMSQCTSLQHVAFPTVWSPTAAEVPLVIGEAFLLSCSNLRSLTFAVEHGALPRAAYLDRQFLASCRSIERVDLSGLSVLEIGTMFCAHCPALLTVDLSRSVSPRAKVASLFLASSEAIVSIHAPSSGPVAKAADKVLSRIAHEARNQHEWRAEFHDVSEADDSDESSFEKSTSDDEVDDDDGETSPASA